MRLCIHSLHSTSFFLLSSSDPNIYFDTILGFFFTLFHSLARLNARKRPSSKFEWNRYPFALLLNGITKTLSILVYIYNILKYNEINWMNQTCSVFNAEFLIILFILLILFIYLLFFLSIIFFFRLCCYSLQIKLFYKFTIHCCTVSISFISFFSSNYTY